MTQALMLALLNLDKTFIILIDASRKVIGVVLQCKRFCKNFVLN